MKWLIPLPISDTLCSSIQHALSFLSLLWLQRSYGNGFRLRSFFSFHIKALTRLANLSELTRRCYALSINNKLLIYKVILKPIWTYGIQLWGTTFNSNIDILEPFQSKVLRLIVDAPWYVWNSVIRNDLQIPTVKEEISRFSSHYNVRISVHLNELIASLTEPPIQRRLRRYWPHNLPVRFWQLVLIVFFVRKF
jgi:hypothetical protein